jgi:hypothetical protein
MKLTEALTESKQYKKASKLLGHALLRDFVAKNDDELKEVIVRKSMEIQEATMETQANSEYQKAKGIVSDFNKALRDKNSESQTLLSLASYMLKLRKDGE